MPDMIKFILTSFGLKIIAIVIYLLLFYLINKSSAQSVTKDSVPSNLCKIPQKDVGDYVKMIIKKTEPVKCDTTVNRTLGPFLSPFIYPGYELVTSYLVGIACNVSFYTYQSDSAKISSVLFDNYYSEHKQLFATVNSNVFTSNEKYNLQGDWRYYKFPTTTYGLGSNTSFANATNVDYNYLRFYEAIMKCVTDNLFIGIGYNFDYHFNITETKITGSGETDIENYTFGNNSETPFTNSTSSGISINLQYDSRLNCNNPKEGTYVNLKIRDNLTALGSNTNWQSLILDARKYIHLSKNSGNLLAIWNYDWLTLSGKPPYFDLPTIGSDAYDNTGRGYAEGRFKGLNMLYDEAEYRFGILKSGLISGVVFINASTFSNYSTLNPSSFSAKFDKINSGYGAGFRIKLNKNSDTNLCFDYGIGTGGSNCFAFNLGEVF